LNEVTKSSKNLSFFAESKVSKLLKSRWKVFASKYQYNNNNKWYTDDRAEKLFRGYAMASCPSSVLRVTIGILIKLVTDLITPWYRPNSNMAAISAILKGGGVLSHLLLITKSYYKDTKHNWFYRNSDPLYIQYGRHCDYLEKLVISSFQERLVIVTFHVHNW